MKILNVFAVLLFIGGCHPKTTENKTEVSKEAITAVQDGKTLYGTCKACHGDNAEGNELLGAPALVNQDAWYLERQVNHFKSGIRGADAQDTFGRQMAVIAQTLPDSAAISAVVNYLKTLPGSFPAKTLRGNVQLGHDAYNMICGACHGPGAEGNEQMNAPKLTGIDDWYLKRQLQDFKSALRGSHPGDKWGAQMIPMSQTLKDEQAIDNVVAYIQSLQQINP